MDGDALSTAFFVRATLVEISDTLLAGLPRAYTTSQDGPDLGGLLARSLLDIRRDQSNKYFNIYLDIYLLVC